MVFLLLGFALLGRAVFEAEAVVAGFQYVAVVGEPIEERGGHLGIAEHAGTLTEAEVGGDDDDGALVEFTQQLEAKSSDRFAELMLVKLLKEYWFGVDQTICELPK